MPETRVRSLGREDCLEKGMAIHFSSSHVWMWKLDHKEGWVLKNWCFWTVVLENTLESPLDCKEIKPVKGNQSWIFIGRTDAEAEAPILWPPDTKSQLIRKDWCWERLKAGEGDNRGSDGWMASLIQRTWVWVSSGRWWRTGKPGMLQSVGSQRVGHNWPIEQQPQQQPTLAWRIPKTEEPGGLQSMGSQRVRHN